MKAELLQTKKIEVLWEIIILLMMSSGKMN